MKNEDDGWQLNNRLSGESVMNDFNDRSRRSIFAGAILSAVLLVVCVVVFLWFNQETPLDVEIRADLDGNAIVIPDKTAPSATSPTTEQDTKTLENVESAQKDAEEQPDAPPLLTGKVTGDDAGIGGAEVRLFALQDLKRTLRRLERLAPRGSEIPDIRLIVDEVRAALRSLRKKEIVAVSDDEGVYTFQAPPADTYLVLTTASGWMFHFGDVVDLDLGRTITKDMELYRGESISGQIVNTGGLPLPGVRIAAEYRPAGVPGIGRIIRRVMRYFNGEFLRGPLETVSAADGTFTLTSLPPGLYDLLAKTPTGIEVREHSVDSSTTDAVITIGKGAIVQGYVLTTVGTPVADIPIQLERMDDRIQLPLAMIAFSDLANTIYNLLGEGARKTTSQRDGSFRFRSLSPGKYQLKIQSPGYLPWFRTFEVAWGERRQLDPVRLDPGSAVFGRVRSESGEAVPGAKVSVVPRKVGMVNMSSTVRDVIGGRNVAVVGEDGTFQVAGLVSGSYRITAGAPGFGVATAQSSAPSEEPVELLLAKGRTVTGRVTDAATKEPIKNAQVKASGVMTETDVKGRYVLEGVVARDPRQNPFGFSGGPGRRARDDREPRPETVSVEAKADGYAVNKLSLGMAELGKETDFVLEPLPKVVGRVLDPDGNPAPGSLIRLTPVIPDELQEVAFSRLGIDRGIIFLAATVADHEGHFTLTDYSIDQRQPVQVIADHPLYARGVSVDIPIDDLLQNGELSVDVQLGRTGGIEGVVTNGSGPVPRAQIRLRRKRDSNRDESRRIDGFLGMIGIPKSGETMYTNSEGVFKFPKRRPGTYELQAEVQGFKPSEEVVVEVVEGDTSQVTLEVTPGGEIAGTAVDSEGRPIAGVDIRLLRDGKGERTQIQRFLGGAFKRARTAPETGAFAFQGLPDGQFIVIGERTGFVKAEVSGIEPGNTAVQLQLFPAAELVGRVADSASGEPIPEFTVAVVAAAEGRGRNPFNFPRSVQSPDGVFRRSGLQPGKYRVSVKASGYLPMTHHVTLTVGASAEQDFALQQAGRIRGTVVDLQTGRAIDDATIVLSTPEEPPPAETEDSADDLESKRTSVPEPPDPEALAAEDGEALRKFWRTRWSNEDASTLPDGTFLLRGVPSGIQRITVSHPAYIPQRIDNLEVQIGTEATVAIRLRRGVTLTGFIKDAGGQPLNNRFIFLRGTGTDTEWVRKSAMSAPDGRFKIDGLLPGPYRILAPARGAMPALAVEVAGGGAEVEFVVGGE